MEELIALELLERQDVATSETTHTNLLYSIMKTIYDRDKVSFALGV